MSLLTRLFIPTAWLNRVLERRIVWWRTFLLTRLALALIRWGRGILPYTLFLYFYIEELLGLFFLIRPHRRWARRILIIKIGAGEWFFWSFFIVLEWKRLSLLWFLFYNKLPYLAPLLRLREERNSLELVIGLIFLLPLIWIVKRFNALLLFRRTESFTLLLLNLKEGYLEIEILLLFYSINFLLIFRGSSEAFRRELEKMFYFFRIPVRLSFFIKFLLIRTFLKRGLLGILLFILLLGRVRGGFLLILNWLLSPWSNPKQNNKELLIRGLLLLILII
jgi:hypothetical protein